MCGIAGIINNFFSNDQLRGSLQEMLCSMEHRGPDAQGIWNDSGFPIILGHRRLAILDLSDSGAQPMVSQSERYVITFNGEIYNHEELRFRLQKNNVNWRGTSDTETLLTAIEVFGIDQALRLCVGMFGFALWDRKCKKLLLARDRFGEKPLYFYNKPNEFVFGSDLAAIEKYPEFDRIVDIAAVQHFFHRGWQSVEHTIWKSVKKVPPGVLVEVHEDRSISQREYWNSEVEAKASLNRTRNIELPSGIELVDELLTKSVSRQLVSDVPLGAWLSGGIDSSLIVAIIQKLSSRPVKTFSIGFPESGYDESTFSRNIADFLGTDHTDAMFSHADAAALVPSLPAIFSEPFADASQLPTILLSQITKEHVTVALSGDGADELFGGYNRYVSGQKLEQIRSFGFGLGSLALRAASHLPYVVLYNFVKKMGHNTVQFDKKHHKAIKFLRSRNVGEIYLASIDKFYAKSDNFLKITTDSSMLKPPIEYSELNYAQQLMLFDIMNYLPEDVLVKVDRSAMSASLEIRAPFLDPDLFKLAWSLPHEFKISGIQNKFILRKLLAKYIPVELFDRPKQGFTPPIGHLMTGPLNEWTETFFSCDELKKFSFLNIESVRHSWKTLKNGDFSEEELLWRVIIFVAWAQSRRISI